MIKALKHTDKDGDIFDLTTSGITSNVYASVNGGVQVRIAPEDFYKFREFFGEPAKEDKSDSGEFFLIRQKKEEPSKVKVCWAQSTTSRIWTDRAMAEAAAKRQNENYPKWNYFVVKKETV